MALTQTIVIADELKNVQATAFEQRDRYELGVIQAHKSELSLARKKLIKEMSLLGYLKTLWRELTPEEKLVWKTAGAYSGLSGWQLFVSDNAQRLKYDLETNIPPSDLWQVRTGKITIESPAQSILLKQEHPSRYWVAGKVAGKSWKNELVLLTENFSLPLELGIRYKTDLTAVDAPHVARYYARVWTSYQGQDIQTDVEIPLTPTADWNYATITQSYLRGIIIGYTLFLEVQGYRGTILFDNIKATHGGTNWVRDPRCDDIQKTFTKAYSVVPPFWVPVAVSEGALYTSVFPPSL